VVRERRIRTDNEVGLLNDDAADPRQLGTI